MKQENLFEPNCIRTFMGHYIDPLNADPSKIEILDIAHALSMQPRFSGHLPRFLSVAEHCCFCFDKAPDEFKKDALLHDASEAYLLDMPSPIKYRIPGYVEIEDRLMKVIALKFGLQYPFHTIVKEIDKQELVHEWFGIMLSNGRKTWTQGKAKYEFIERWEAVKNA